MIFPIGFWEKLSNDICCESEQQKKFEGVQVKLRGDTHASSVYKSSLSWVKLDS